MRFSLIASAALIGVAATGCMTMKPKAEAYSATLEHVVDRDIVLYSLLPHAHLRGRAAKFTAIYPDGRKEILLSVPKYDFNWQTTYALNPPKPIPAGTHIVLDMTWDNSAQNPANPDPNRVVHWGEQTWDEMNVGWVRYRYAEEDEPQPTARDAGAESSSR